MLLSSLRRAAFRLGNGADVVDVVALRHQGGEGGAAHRLELLFPVLGKAQVDIVDDGALFNDGLYLVVFKGPVIEVGGLFKVGAIGQVVAVLVVDVRAHEDQHVFIAAFLCGGDEAASGFVQGAGLHTGDNGGIVVGLRVQHFVGVAPGVAVLIFVGWVGGVGNGGNDLREGLVFHGVLGNQVHIVGGGVVVFVKETVGVGEVGVDRSQAPLALAFIIS